MEQTKEKSWNELSQEANTSLLGFEYTNKIHEELGKLVYEGKTLEEGDCLHSYSEGMKKALEIFMTLIKKQ